MPGETVRKAVARDMSNLEKAMPRQDGQTRLSPVMVPAWASSAVPADPAAQQQSAYQTALTGDAGTYANRPASMAWPPMIPRGSHRVLALLALGLPVVASGFAQPPRDYSGNCTTSDCHGGLKAQRVVHAPVASDSCDACHQPVEGDAHRFTSTATGTNPCADCHDLDEVKVPHSPVQAGECMACHEPHASPTDDLLKGTSVGALCAECHEDITEDRQHLHGPVAAGACTACHPAHGSDNASMLSEVGTALCFSCHAEMEEHIDEATTVHAPSKDGCTSCHNPHGAATRMLTTSGLPGLCFECHDDIGEALEEGKAAHDVVLSDRSCSHCHDPHASRVGSLLINKPMLLCLACHNQPVVSGGERLRNIEEHLKNNANHHGPLRDEDCTACHDAHASATFRLLTNTYPSRFYTPYHEKQFALCFDCHDGELAAHEKADDETGFRNGSLNLHFVHVNRATKGRTCRACHDVHASDNAKHIARSVPFGEWSIPINFSATATGGSCQPGCHRPHHYDREAAADRNQGSAGGGD